MTYWVAAPSARALLTQADAQWPDRNKAADGTIGDLRHQHEAGGSDHNPDPRGIVHAADLTQDPAHGVDCAVIAENIRDRKDHRVRYVIFNRRIFLGPWSDGVMGHQADPWVWQPYNGTDPHTGHLHLSIGYNPDVENDTSDWYAPAVPVDPKPLPRPAPPVGTPAWYRRVLRDLGKGKYLVGPDVAHVQAVVGVPLGNRDGVYGPGTAAAIGNWQQRHGLDADGVVGPNTARKIG